MRIRPLLLGAAALLGAASPGGAVPVTYTSESQFLSDLAAAGLALCQEGFEDDAAWGAVRSTIAGGNHIAPSVTHLGVTWTANDPGSGVTTGPGPALHGQWGFYSLPHTVTVGDGWTCTGESPLYAAGGWIKTNTPPAELAIVLDDTITLTENWILDTAHRFIGIIELEGFSSVRFQDVEAAGDEGKYLFGDDFSFGLDASTAAPPAPVAEAPRILGNYPNPFNPATRLVIALPAQARISLELFDASGRRLRSLRSGTLPAGRQSIEWDGRDEAGRTLPAGIYLARLRADAVESWHRLVLLK